MKGAEYALAIRTFRGGEVFRDELEDAKRLPQPVERIYPGLKRETRRKSLDLGQQVVPAALEHNCDSDYPAGRQACAGTRRRTAKRRAAQPRKRVRLPGPAPLFPEVRRRRGQELVQTLRVHGL